MFKRPADPRLHFAALGRVLNLAKIVFLLVHVLCSASRKRRRVRTLRTFLVSSNGLSMGSEES